MSTPVLTASHLREMAALEPAALAAALAADPGHYRRLLEEHMRLRDQVGTLNELALARSLLHECRDLGTRALGKSERPASTIAEVRALVALLDGFLRNHDRVTVATMIGLRRDRDRLRVLFNDGVTDRIAIDIGVLEIDTLADAGGPHHWCWPLGMREAPLDPLRGRGKEQEGVRHG